MPTTTTFYSGAGDGRAARQIVSEAWATLRGGAGTDSSYTDASQNYAGTRCTSTTNQFEWIQRSFLPFDTSALTSAASISSATVNVYGSARDASIDHYIWLDKTTPASTSVLANSDYNSSHHSFTKQSDTGIAISAWNLSGYNAFPLNATGIGNINKTGVTEFGGKLDVDFADTIPSWSSIAYSYAQCYYSEQTGTTKDPYISVTYTLVTGPVNVKSVNGLAAASVKSKEGLAYASVKSINGLA